MRRLLVRGGAVLAGVVAAGLIASPAFAHVTITPTQETQGGFTVITFRVPNEEDTATTTKVEVDLPADAPIAGVSVRSIPGWTATITTTKLASPLQSDDGPVTEAVSKVVWVATPSAAIKPGEFQAFDLSVGPLPEVDQIIFKALQTYSDGTVVRWIDEPNPGGAEPEHPAPVLKLVAANATAAPAASGTSSGGGGGSGLAVALSIVALVAAGAAIFLTLRRPQRS